MKKIVILFFLTSSFELFACKAVPVQMGDVNDIDFMSKVLIEAKNIYIGKIVNDSSVFESKPVQVFKVKKIWKSNVPDINAQEWFKSEMHIQNKQYGENDFVSSHDSGLKLGCPTYHLYRDQEPNKYYLYIRDSRVQYTIPIEKAKLLIMKLNDIDTGKNINPSLQFCESDSQCVKASSNCSISINKVYVNQLNSSLKTFDSNLCKTQKAITLKCVEWFCE